MTADFEGVLPTTGSMEDLEAVMNQPETADPVTLEDDVYRRGAIVLRSDGET